MHQNLPESSGKHVTGLFIGTIPNIGHQILALKTSANPVVNTLGFAPVSLQKHAVSKHITLYGKKKHKPLA